MHILGKFVFKISVFTSNSVQNFNRYPKVQNCIRIISVLEVLNWDCWYLMERNHFLLTQRFLTCAAILLLTILPITFNTTQTKSVYRLLDIGQFMIPLLIGFFTSMHFFIDIYMFGYLTKSMSKRGTVAPFGRTILVFGSLSCHILIFLFIKNEFCSATKNWFSD